MVFLHDNASILALSHTGGIQRDPGGIREDSGGFKKENRWQYNNTTLSISTFHVN